MTNRKTVAGVLAAVLLTLSAAADMPEYPSAIDNDCALFRGTWASKSPEIADGTQVWTFVSITDDETALIDYRITPDGGSTAHYGRFAIACARDGKGGFVLTLTRRNGELQSHEWHVALNDLKTLTRMVRDSEGRKAIPYIRYQGLKPTEGDN